MCVWAVVYLSSAREEGEEAGDGVPSVHSIRRNTHCANPPSLPPPPIPSAIPFGIYTVPPVPLSATSQQQAGLDSLTPLFSLSAVPLFFVFCFLPFLFLFGTFWPDLSSFSLCVVLCVVCLCATCVCVFKGGEEYGAQRK